MIKLSQPIIVEGKYDKITLQNVVDAPIITTDGFNIFNNKEKREMLRTLAQKNGIIVMTDSDSAGDMIRAHIKNIVGDSEIINVYIPTLKGKERRKATPSKSGLLGVEGMTPDIIKTALEKSGVIGRKIEKEGSKITKQILFEIGLSGRENSSFLRKELLRHIGLPQTLSPNAMLDILNTLYTQKEFYEVIKNVKAE